MVTLKASPFKVDTVENDPQGFGLRTKEIIACAKALYNNQSILISGPRGIGKSSLGLQMQKVMEGDNTLLKRCGIDEKFPKTFCLFYACDKEYTLEQFAMDILYSLEREFATISALKNAEISPSLEINFGIIKTKLEGKASSGKKSPTTIATILVDGLETVYKVLNKTRFVKRINIMLDEIDQLSPDINFGHFLKVVQATLDSRSLKEITFTLAGQKGVFSRFNKEDESFERLVRHIPLAKLNGDASSHILEYASLQASPSFGIQEKARELILGLASGYPYTIHLLGNEAFMGMPNERLMTENDVLDGLEIILKSDKREKYLERFMECSPLEHRVLLVLSEHNTSTIPAEVSYKWLLKKANIYIDDEQKILETTKSLIAKGHLTEVGKREKLVFNDEMFRVFLSLSRLEQKELAILKLQKEEKKLQPEQIAEEIRDLISLEDYDELSHVYETLIESDDFNSIGDIRELSEKERKWLFSKIRTVLENAEFTRAWDEDRVTGSYFDTYKLD